MFLAATSNVSASMKSEIKGFLEHVQLFYIRAALQIKQRFPINDEILKSLIVLNPDTINSTPATEAATKFPNIIPTAELRLQFMDPNDLPQFTA